VLVTGGAGYIGSHTVLALLLSGARVTVVDNLINSSRESLKRVQALADEEAKPRGVTPGLLEFREVDLRNYAALEGVFKEKQQQQQASGAAGAAAGAGRFDAVIHFAGLKAVGESVSRPMEYYEHNVVGTLNLLRLCDAYHCRSVVFSSSATVYGLAEKNPIDETAPLATTNPYGQTKLVIEEMMRDIAKAPVQPAADGSAGDNGWRIVLLRYFNPIGAHPSGQIGEDPLGVPNNLLPFVMQVAVGRRAEVSVFGGDYPTPDGTGVRDYIHVSDLAEGHLAALEHGVFGDALVKQDKRCDVFNLGTGSPVSVLQMIAAAEKASGNKIAYKIAPRRTGDIATCYADASKAAKLLHWRTRRTLEEAVADSWRWQKQNPEGFSKQATTQ
jgi:UDP-glucose 4-epimerase